MNLLVTIVRQIGVVDNEKNEAYKAVEADPVRMSLTTRSALHLEGVEIRVLFSISGLESSDAGF